MEIDEDEFKKFVDTEFGGRDYRFCPDEGYISIQAGDGTKSTINDLHYELHKGQIALHIEGDSWWIYRNELCPLLENVPELEGRVWFKRQNAQWVLKTSKEDIFGQFRKIRDIVEPILKGESVATDSTAEGEDVYFQTCGLDIFKKNLNIPEYQRIYAWQPEHVERFIDNFIEAIDNGIPFHVGSIILHNTGKSIDIVDGQQRLVTISLILKRILDDATLEAMGVLSFLKNGYSSSEALNNIYNNYRFINDYFGTFEGQRKIDIINNGYQLLLFSVLQINDNSKLDLAFTFFSNTNSKGVKLTDYDLLKPHHLRYIPSELEKQQEHLAKKWDTMINENRYSQDKYFSYIRLVEKCLYRLRHWANVDDCNIWLDHYIKQEFEAAPVIDEIPPFCEQFRFDEPIQGGQHFFAYIEYFLEKYRKFETKDLLVKYFGCNDSHSWYATVIEALVFCYYLKFGENYLPEAVLAITRYVSIIRFSKGRAYEKTILAWAKDSKIVLMIQRVTSSTFFLAEIEKAIDRKVQEVRQNGEPEIVKKDGVRCKFKNMCEGLSKELGEKVTVEKFMNYENRYSTISVNA